MSHYPVEELEQYSSDGYLTTTETLEDYQKQTKSYSFLGFTHMVCKINISDCRSKWFDICGNALNLKENNSSVMLILCQ